MLNFHAQVLRDVCTASASPYSKEQLTLGAINRFCCFKRMWRIRMDALGSYWEYCHGTHTYRVQCALCMLGLDIAEVHKCFWLRWLIVWPTKWYATNSKAHLCSIDKLQSKQQSLGAHNCIGAIKLKFKCMALCVCVHCAATCTYTYSLTFNSQGLCYRCVLMHTSVANIRPTLHTRFLSHWNLVIFG